MIQRRNFRGRINEKLEGEGKKKKEKKRKKVTTNQFARCNRGNGAGN